MALKADLVKAQELARKLQSEKDREIARLRQLLNENNGTSQYMQRQRGKGKGGRK